MHSTTMSKSLLKSTELVYTEGCTQSQDGVINQAGLDYGGLTDAAVKWVFRSMFCYFADTIALGFKFFSALKGNEDTAFKEFFGTASNARYRTITSRFYNLQGAKQCANTQEQQPITFSFTCIDKYGGCRAGVGAHVKNPEANLVTFCGPFFRLWMHRLSDMCTYSGYVPSNDGIYYNGAKFHLLYEFCILILVRAYTSAWIYAPRERNETAAHSWYVLVQECPFKSGSYCHYL